MYTSALSILLLALATFGSSFRLERNFDTFLSGVPKESDGKIWAVLVAGSNTWGNYRHQADICHAYQVVSSHGIPDENIIVMMYDDIAKNEENPTPGIIINKPNGTDVYKGVINDYTGEDVNPNNFISVLTGDEKAVKGIGSGRVLKSGPNDHVFVNFADHGGVGILAFPSEYLYVQDFIAAIKTMHSKNMYGKLVFYVEACESGSMFENVLPNDINVYTTTAASPDESSFACYWDDKRGTFLGDVYSVKWMEDSDKEDLQQETLKQQYLTVKQETTTSHVQQYGQVNISDMTVSEYQGRKEPSKMTKSNKSVKITEAIPSREVPKVTLQRKLLAAKDDKTRMEISEKLLALEAGRQLVQETVMRIVDGVTNNEHLSRQMLGEKMRLFDLRCHQALTAHFSNKCFNLAKNPYSTSYLQVLVNMCEAGYTASSVMATMDSVCAGFSINGIV